MFVFNTRLFVFLFVIMFSAACYGDGDKEKTIEKETAFAVNKKPSVSSETIKKVDVSPASSNTEKKDESSASAFDIMKPLYSNDPCFIAVELIRDQGDVATYSDLGDAIIIKGNEVPTDSHRTYMSIIGKMLKEKKEIREIRQTLLDTCRSVISK